jgi:hypothetical protein
MTTNAENIRLLRLMVRGSYDLQALRMQAGLRLCANFRAKLQPEASDDDTEDGEMSDVAIKIIDTLKASYRRMTDGVARNRTIPTAAGFHGDEVISDYTELMLIDQYIRLESQETSQFNQLIHTLEKIPIYTEYLANVRGVGPALAAVLITYFDPHKAPYVSSFWSYCGLDVAADGRGRSKRAEHLVDREYVDKNGKSAVRKSTTYTPWLKMKLINGLGTSFLRSNSPWRSAFDGYKHRIMSDPNRIKVTVVEWKKLHAAGEDISQVWAPGRIKNAAIRYMVKMFLSDLWVTWRKLEGLPVTEPYAVGKLGLRPHHQPYLQPPAA